MQAIVLQLFLTQYLTNSMKKFIIIIAALCCSLSASAWSRHIHSGIAAIAHDNLTEEAKKSITELLDGKSIVYYAQHIYDYADNEAYKHTKVWRNIAFTDKNKILKTKKAAKHEHKAISSALAYEGLVSSLTALQSGKLTKEQTRDNMLCVITILSDLHCPTHYVFTDNLEKRKSYYHYNDKKYSYIGYWESNSIRGTFNWKTNEFVHQLSRKTPEQIAQITEGSVTDWITGNAQLYRSVYDLLDTGTRFDGKSLRLWQNKIYPISTEQVAVAGYRIAAVLNSLFDSNAPQVKIK